MAQWLNMNWLNSKLLGSINTISDLLTPETALLIFHNTTVWVNGMLFVESSSIIPLPLANISHNTTLFLYCKDAVDCKISCPPCLELRE